MKKLFLIIIYCLIFGFAYAQSWSSVGSGVTGLNAQVNSIREYNGSLYVAGEFSNAGGMNANSIAKWDGNSWSPLIDSSIGNGILTMTVYHNSLYVGGIFHIDSGTTICNNVAKWNGVNWSPVVNGTTNYVIGSAVFQNNLYIASSNSNSGDSLIAKWNDTTWTLSNFNVTGFGSLVEAIAVFNGELYIAGTFTIAGNNAENYIAKWNGTNWSPVGLGLNRWVRSLAVYNGELYAAGNFDSAGTVPANGIARWNGTTWSSLTNSPNASLIRTMTAYHNELYVGGYFDSIGSVSARNIARWNGTNWSNLGLGLKNVVNSLEIYNNDLYAGGNFDSAGNVMSPKIAKWNSPVGIEDFFSSNSLHIFPNPTFDKITIKSCMQLDYIELHDLSGKLLKQNKLADKEFELDVTDLSAGIYFITINQKGKLFHNKVVKQH